MEIDIIEVKDGKQKSAFAELILNKLPEWFGNTAAKIEYIENVSLYPFWAAMYNGKCVGFFSVKIHYEWTGDIYVCGIDPEYHNKGIGNKLFKVVEDYVVSKGCKYIIVKTLSELAKYEPYSRTRKFYKKVGFNELITLTEMWDSENPCLIMLKVIQ